MTKLHYNIANVFVLLNVIGMIAMSTNAYAQNNTSNPQDPLPSTNSNAGTSPITTTSNPVTPVRTSEINGDLTKIDGGKITVLDSSGKAYEYSLNDSIKITRDTNIVKSNDIKVGDKVKIIIDTDKNTLIGLEAISGQIFDFAKYAIPAVILGIVVIALIIYAINKSNQGKIMIPTDSANQ